jgi:hypothetical protein
LPGFDNPPHFFSVGGGGGGLSSLNVHVVKYLVKRDTLLAHSSTHPATINHQHTNNAQWLSLIHQTQTNKTGGEH